MLSSGLKINCFPSTCDWNIAPFLDRNYTVFGKVVAGMEHIDKIKKGDSNNNGAVEDPDKIISFKSL